MYCWSVTAIMRGGQLYKAALGNCFETEEWGPIEFCIMAKHFDRQGKAPYAYHAVSDWYMHPTVTGIIFLSTFVMVIGIENDRIYNREYQT